MFWTLTYFKPNILEATQRLKMECFAKVVHSFNYFTKLYLRSFPGFWISPSLNTHSLVEWTRSMYCMSYIHNSDMFRNLSIIVNSDILRHITYLEPYVPIAYSEPCHIQNLVIFRTPDIFRNLSRHIPAYRKLYNDWKLRALPYSKWTQVIFRTMSTI